MRVTYVFKIIHSFYDILYVYTLIKNISFYDLNHDDVHRNFNNFQLTRPRVQQHVSAINLTSSSSV